MARAALTLTLILLFLLLGLLPGALSIDAAPPSNSPKPVNPHSVQSDDSKNATGGQIAVPLTRDEIDSLAAALPEGEARRMFKEKSAAAARKDQPASAEAPVAGEEMATLFYDTEKAFSRVQEGMISFFTKPTATVDSPGWAEALENLHEGRGFGHLMLSFFILALMIIGGLAMEMLVRRFTEGLRRQILDSPLLGRLQFLGRVASRLLLNLLGLGAYALTTFVVFALFYDEGDPGYTIISMTLIVTYYIRCAILAADLVLSPAAPGLRLFPLQDEDATFLYRWFVRISVTMMVIGTISYIFLYAGGISQQRFEIMYSMGGVSVVILVVVMIWRGRRRVARAIWPEDPAGGEAKSPLRARFARSWHRFAMLYVIAMGTFWVVKGLAQERGALIPLLASIFLIPVFIGLSHWIEYLLSIAAGVSVSSFIPKQDNGRETDRKPRAAQAEEADDGTEDQKSYIRHHLPLIKGALRILLAALMFFLMLRLWGIDLPIGRIFTSTALNIIGLVLLGVVVWQYTKARIDRRLRQEMPDADEDMEEGGAGGSRIGTLLVLLRKFILSVLFVLISLIILSSIGVNIGPLIAGAGVIGLAIGFGSQTLVKDILSGVFFLIDDAFRVGDYIETAGTKGMVEHISLRSVKLRHPRGMVYTIPFGMMGSVQNFSRDYIITKLDFRVRYGTDVDQVRKIIKRINAELEQDEELGPTLLGKIKSQGVRELDDSAMIMRVKYKTKPGQQFMVRREVFRRIEEAFRKNGIEFAHRNVTVYLPPEVTGAASETRPGEGKPPAGAPNKKLIEAGAAAAITVAHEEKKEVDKAPER